MAIGLVSGLLVFGALFAINSSIHSYLIVAYAREDGASLDVGFYYMCNAAGRLVGTLLSGLIYQQFGLAACLLALLGNADHHCGDLEKATGLNRRTNFYRGTHGSARVCVF